MFRPHTAGLHQAIASILLSRAICTTVYDGAIYEQQDGAAMGSPVSAVIANLYMEDFEEQPLSSTPTAPKIRKRYVNDTFLKRNDVKDFLQHLNTQQPTASVLQWRLRLTTQFPFLTHWSYKRFRRTPHKCLQKNYAH